MAYKFQTITLKVVGMKVNMIVTEVTPLSRFWSITIWTTLAISVGVIYRKIHFVCRKFSSKQERLIHSNNISYFYE